MNQQEIRNQLKTMGLRATSTRVAVLHVLKNSDRPLSHSEMVQELREMHGDQATIYRTLITFLETAIIRIASNVGGISRYEIVDSQHNHQHVHPHFVCKNCGIVSCLPKTTVTQFVDEQWKAILRSAEMQFLGICLKCR